MNSLTYTMPNFKKDPDYYKHLKWQFALENSNIGIWDFDADLNRVFYSKESKKIIGFDTDEFGSNPNDWNERVHPEDREKYFQDFQDHLKGLKTIYTNEHRVQCKDKSYKWIADKGKIVEWTENGQPKRIIGTHTDITEIKKKETQLASSLDIITSQNKKLLNFAHIVTHNLRTHTGNFESIIEFYEEAESNREKAESFKHLKTISNALSNSIENLNDLVKLETIHTHEVEDISLHEFTNNTIYILEHQITKAKAQIENKINPEIKVNFNKAYLESIIQNLLTNAIKYRKPDVKPEIKITSEELGDTIIVKVKDNGIGIDLEKYGQKLFGMYNTFHNKTEYDSRGIGLYLIRNQLESLGGSIHVESEIEKGTTFIVTFKK